MSVDIQLTLTDRGNILASGELEEKIKNAAPILATAVAGDPQYEAFQGWRTVDESAGPERVQFLMEIGRASCRERV